MNKDIRLLNETLDVFRKVRNWVPPEYYKEFVTPIVLKIKERLAVVETEVFIANRALANEKNSKKFEESQHQTKIQDIEKTEPDTIPSELASIQDQFGIFKKLD